MAEAQAAGMLGIRGLSFRYPKGAAPVLQDIDLTLPRGRILGLLGPNGAGKTTLISILSGLLPPGTGQLEVGGTALAALRRERPALLAAVPQDYAFYPMLTVAENLSFFGGVQGLRGEALRERVAYCTRFGQLQGFLHQRAAVLSGGLRRRLNLAIGLLAEPEVLLLDEPTVGVDPQARHFLLDAIRSLRDAGKTILYTSHYMDEVEAICDFVAIIDHGRILLSGSLSDVLAHGGGQTRLRFAQALDPQLLARWQTQYGMTIEAAAAGAVYVLPQAGFEMLPKLLEEVAAARCALLGLSCGAQNLEQVFMRLTKRSLRD